MPLNPATPVYGKTSTGANEAIGCTTPTAATQALTLSGNANASETFSIGGLTYTWTATAASYTGQTPFFVKIGVDAATSIANAAAAINGTASKGTLFSNNTGPNPYVTAVATSSTVLTITANAPGADGNGVTTTETMANATWGAATTTAGVSASLNVSATVTIDPSSLATSANQTTQIAAEQATQSAVEKIIPATTAAAVTPSDSTALTSRAVWVGGTGDLAVRLSGATGTTVVFTAVPAGTLLPMSVVRVMAATTATNINVLN